MRKVETRIKVITKGDNLKYIPQIKGFNLDHLKDGRLYLIPLFGQIFLFVSFCGFISSLFWDRMPIITNWFDPLPDGSKEEAKRVIDEFWEEYNKSKQIKHKKQVSYIKYP